MNIETSRLILSEVSWDDVDDIHHLHSIAEVDEYNTLGIPASEVETREIIRPVMEDQQSECRKLYMWKIVRKIEGNFIGVAGLILSADRFRLGEIYYKLLPSSWGHGYATEVGRALIKSGFEHFKLHKIEAGVATENEKSVRVLEKLSMLREGVRRKILPIRGEWKDSYHYGIVEDDRRNY
ncbi:MAG: GNAT family N-acetyltransferase [Cyclobacteriaceae bacterium]|nr:GNAT family N-acetyltransferase [Cyclobacteriaceae bacterium]